uniref:Uncharacterized protein LOC100180441 n=1 Tax=Phallusia mammillata TaxID=59560 RepID=A0A6F9DGP5_9ASCI|nr:uncharacterized protein LOC100180441 [Phallusia mammillata]
MYVYFLGVVFMDIIVLLVGGSYLLALTFCLIALFTPGWFWIGGDAHFGLIQMCLLGKCITKTDWSSYEIGVLSLMCVAVALMVLSMGLFINGVIKKSVQSIDLSGVFIIISGCLCVLAAIIFIVYLQTLAHQKSYGYSFGFCWAADAMTLMTRYGLNSNRWHSSNPFQPLN